MERVIRDAFERRHPADKITLVHKHNVLVNAGGLWRGQFEAVAAEYPGSSTDYLHVDAATIFLVTDPARFDVIVTDNLFGDILTDLAAAVTGGIGLAASGNINPDRTLPVDVRAGARLGTGHRRPGHRRPDGDDPVGQLCCLNHWSSGGGGTDRESGGRGHRPRVAGRRRGRPARSATPSPRRVAVDALTRRV